MSHLCTQAEILYKRMALWLDLIGFTVQLSYPTFPLVYPNWGTVTVVSVTAIFESSYLHASHSRLLSWFCVTDLVALHRVQPTFRQPVHPMLSQMLMLRGLVLRVLARQLFLPLPLEPPRPHQLILTCERLSLTGRPQTQAQLHLLPPRLRFVA